MTNLTAGDTDPDLAVAPQQAPAAPVDAAPGSQTPEATLTPDNGNDDDTDLTPEQLQAMRQQFWNQEQAPPVQAPAETTEAPAPETQTAPPAEEPSAAPPENTQEPQFRVRPRDEKEARVLRLIKADPELSLIQATELVYGKPQAAQEATPVAEAAPAVNDVERIEQELAALAAEAWQDDFEAKRTAKLIELQKAVARQQAEEMSASARREAEQKAAQDAEWQGLCQKYRGLEHPNSTLNQRAQAVLQRWQDTGDPRLQSTNLFTVAVESAAAELYAEGVRPASPQNPTPAAPQVPQPAPATRYNPSAPGGTQPPPVRVYSDEEFERLQEENPAAAAQVLADARRRNAVPVRR